MSAIRKVEAKKSVVKTEEERGAMTMFECSKVVTYVANEKCCVS